MESGKLIISIISVVAGLLFVFNNKNVAKGAHKFYTLLYTEKNLKIIFRVLGILLIIGAVVLIFFK